MSLIIKKTEGAVKRKRRKNAQRRRKSKVKAANKQVRGLWQSPRRGKVHAFIEIFRSAQAAAQERAPIVGGRSRWRNRKEGSPAAEGLPSAPEVG